MLLGVAQSRVKEKDLTEDSLQALVSREPENPSHWFGLGALAAKNNQLDLAKGYFDEGIKVSDNTAKAILNVGNTLISLGKTRAALTYLMPNLAHLELENMDQLQAALEKEKLYSAQLLVLRNWGLRTTTYQTVNRRAAILAFRLGELPVCVNILSRFFEQVDFEGARNLLLINFFQSGTLDPKIPTYFEKHFPQGEINALVHLNLARQGKFREVKDYFKHEVNSPSYRDYYYLMMALEAAATDHNEEAVENFTKAQEFATWDRLRVVIDAELYRFYASTGNKFKADQTWDNLKEQYQDKDPDLQEFMGMQLQIAGYEKQSKYFYRVVLRRKPGNVTALQTLYDDLMSNEDYQVITDNLKFALEKDPLSCEANQIAMNFHFHQKNDKEILPYARNSTVYCFDVVEPYYILGNTLMNLSKPDEARASFATYVRKGGDLNKVPMSLR